MIPGLVLCTRCILPCMNSQTVALGLCKMAFWLSCKVVFLPFDSSTSKAYLCDQGGTAFSTMSYK